MPGRAPRAPFVVTFALGAAAIASGCGGKASGNDDSGDGGNADGNNGDVSAACPAEEPASGPCDAPPSVQCVYGTCNGGAHYCVSGTCYPQAGVCVPPAA